MRIGAVDPALTPVSEMLAVTELIDHLDVIGRLDAMIDGLAAHTLSGNALLMEIPHFVMERRMLLGIKRRAEQAHTAALRRAAQAQPARTAVHA